MFIECPSCRNSFSPNENQKKFIQESIEKKMSFIMIECGVCHHTIPLNPLNLSTEFTPAEDQLRCPVIGCYGYISLIEDNKFACGECGNVWESKNDLFNDIRKVITKYPYRKKVYIFDKNDIRPISSIKEPKDYDDMVRKELFT